MIKGCSTCKHWRGGVVCDAFPNGIPWPIQSGDMAHDKPLPEDNGIQWEPRDTEGKSDDDIGTAEVPNA